MSALTKQTQAILLFFARLLIFLVVLELLLRLVGVYKTSSEKSSGQYQYFFENDHDTWFHVWEPNSTSFYSNPECLQANKYNELGHREKSFLDFKEDTSSIKIVCLGDSFTEGDGTVYDSSWVSYVSNQLNQNDSLNYNLYNAGVCGSDVFYNYMMLKENLLQANPDYVIECINNSDLTDVYYLGGMERFQIDGNTGSPNSKAWEVFYKYSFVFRFALNVFTPYDKHLVVKEKELATKILIAEQISRTHDLCIENNIPYLVVVMPTPYEIVEKDSEFDFETFHLTIEEKVNVHSLFTCMQSELGDKNIEDYYWVKDGHYNGKGYEVLGKSILKKYLQLKAKHKKDAL